MALVNEVHAIATARKDSNALEDVFDRLIDYTEFHFKHEEMLFELYYYPFAEAHSVEHRELIRRVLVFREKFTNGGDLNMLEFLAFMIDWLLEHIRTTDMAYKSFFENRNIN